MSEAPLAARPGSAATRGEMWMLLYRLRFCFLLLSTSVTCTWESRVSSSVSGLLLGVAVTLILWGCLDQPPNSELNDSKSQYPVANTPPKAEESQ